MSVQELDDVTDVPTDRPWPKGAVEKAAEKAWAHYKDTYIGETVKRVPTKREFMAGYAIALGAEF